MLEIKKKWVLENGEGHYVISLNGNEISCDEAEVNEVIREIIALSESNEKEKERRMTS